MLDLVCHDKAASCARFLGDRHTQIGIDIRASRLRETLFLFLDCLAVNGVNRALPSAKRFHNIKINRGADVITVSAK